MGTKLPSHRPTGPSTAHACNHAQAVEWGLYLGNVSHEAEDSLPLVAPPPRLGFPLWALGLLVGGRVQCGSVHPETSEQTGWGESTLRASGSHVGAVFQGRGVSAVTYAGQEGF